MGSKKIETDVLLDNENEETSYAKGNKLEREFAEFMKSDLGWDSVRVGVHLTGAIHRKGASVDIVAERLDERGKKLKTIGVIYAILFLFLLAIGLIEDIEVLLYCSIVFEFAGIVAFIVSVGKNKEHALVECKNLKSKVSAGHIDKTLREIEDYKASKNSEFKFTHHYFVSASGYVETTLKYALEKGIICYVKNGDKFELEKYWK
jgi:hypothetical protein